jgi:hypothetical protein
MSAVFAYSSMRKGGTMKSWLKKAAIGGIGLVAILYGYAVITVRLLGA